MTNPLVRQAIDKTNEAESKIREFFDTINSLLENVPDFLSSLVEPIREGLNWLNKKIQELWDKVRDIQFNPGDSGRLKQVADAWVNQIGNPLGDVAGRSHRTSLRRITSGGAQRQTPTRTPSQRRSPG